MSLFVQISFFLIAVLILVPLAKRLGITPVFGFLLTGIILGPHALNLVQAPDLIQQFIDIGMLMLLFFIGLELRPQRLMQLSKQQIKLGVGQLFLCCLLLLPALIFIFELPLQTGFILGLALALPAIGFVIQQLQQKQLSNSILAQQAFSTLRLHSIAAILLLALLPLLLPNTSNVHHDIAYFTAIIASFSGLFLFGRYAMRPLLRFVVKNGATELIIAAALLQSVLVFIVLNTLTIPMTISALLSGMLLADAEFRHEFEHSLKPFRSLLFGVFFFAIGITLNLKLITTQPTLILSIVLGFIMIKLLALFALSYFYQRNWRQALMLAACLAQGGELAFITIQLAFQQQALNTATFEALMLIAALSLVLAPVLFNAALTIATTTTPTKPASKQQRPTAGLIIAGFGRNGQIIARIAHMQQQPFTVIDNNLPQLDFIQDYSGKMIEGDATVEATLHAAGVENAKVFVLAIDDVESSMQIARYLRLNYPDLCLIARARDRHHLHLLKELGIRHIWRETYLSALGMAYRSLCQLGVSTQQAQQQIEYFRDHDEALIAEQQRIFRDDEKVYESYRNFVEELHYIFESDRQSLLVQQATVPQSTENTGLTDHANISDTRPAATQDRIDIARNEFD